MPSWFIVAFVALDIVFMAIVLAVIFSRRGTFMAAAGVNLKQVMELSNSMEQETEEYLRANWSGDRTTLPVAFNVLLDRFEARAQEKGVSLTRAQLKPMLARLILARRLAESGDVHEALRQVA